MFAVNFAFKTLSFILMNSGKESCLPSTAVCNYYNFSRIGKIMLVSFQYTLKQISLFGKQEITKLDKPSYQILLFEL